MDADCGAGGVINSPGGQGHGKVGGKQGQMAFRGERDKYVLSLGPLLEQAGTGAGGWRSGFL